MTVTETWNNGIQFFNLCTVYYVVQLVRCVLLSFVVFACVFTLRKTALKNRVLYEPYMDLPFAIGTKYFREDMEEICDWVTIKRNEGNAYAYGQLLLKCVRVLQTESKDFNMYATFTGDKTYQSVRQRVARIAAYKPYRRTAIVGAGAAAMLFVTVTVFWMQNVSYDRCNPIDSIDVYDIGTGMQLIGDGKELRKIFVFIAAVIINCRESVEARASDIWRRQI